MRATNSLRRAANAGVISLQSLNLMPARSRRSLCRPAAMASCGLMLLALCLIASNYLAYTSSACPASDVSAEQDGYTNLYPLTKSIVTKDWTQWRIGIIADPDKASKQEDGKSWKATFTTGTLRYHKKHAKITVKWKADTPEDEDDSCRANDPDSCEVVCANGFCATLQLETAWAHGKRAAELSELVVFDGRLLTLDDRTGIVYEIIKNKTVPWVIIPDGPGDSPKGFKLEWATVKSKELWVGSLGKEWTTEQGEYVNDHPQWVKRISRTGQITHIQWTDNYNKLRSELGFSVPGYMIHEAVMWSEVKQRWFFLPRRASTETYTELTDERAATNMLISVREDFSDIKMTKVGKHHATQGFSSFKFLPGSNDDIIVALKSEEDGTTIRSFITAFHVTGELILEPTFVANGKYEGIEFI